MDKLNTIAVVGGGMAGHMSAAALAQILPHNIEITHVKTSQENANDIFYGTVTSPTIYKFLLTIGVSEPDILLGSKTTFSFGTHYNKWCGKSWLQSFHQPLPLFDGVDIHHQLVRHSQATNIPLSLEPYIMSVQAAYNGVFAHPAGGTQNAVG